jgi:hypothetical protein
MWKEILKIIPVLSNGELQKMVNSLNSRFKGVASKFAGGLKNALMGGGIFGLAGGIINKLLNPLQETQESFERTLNRIGDVKDAAAQFDTTPGNLLKLQSIAAVKGLKPDDLNTMLSKFQVAVAEARAKKEDMSLKPEDRVTVLDNFLTETDTVKNFFDFIQSLRAAPKDKQLLAQKDVFGEKMIGRQSAFLNSDFGDLFNKIGALPSEVYTQAVNNIDDVGDLVEEANVRRALNDVLVKAGIIKPSYAKALNARNDVLLGNENDNLKDFEGLIRAQIEADKIQHSLTQVFNELVKVIPDLVRVIKQGIDTADKYTNGDSVVGKTLEKLKDVRAMRLPGGLPGSNGSTFSLK